MGSGYKSLSVDGLRIWLRDDVALFDFEVKAVLKLRIFWTSLYRTLNADFIPPKHKYVT